ncbi:DUF4129 domain-containing protein [Streptomyces sp. MST-110588]|uniref:DUF4129 domain-containing protein n=1 Tax=Streptomyces sp. MST-110588 TaxID=2833628 RepID=UPI001F5DB33A|nr:DUF4129 domain-containing protein [Streptomyces sp. MST-110588]UNO41707.1 DUF4129 domain-containing protein [Streptomyces sp. MST-110588]
MTAAGRTSALARLLARSGDEVPVGTPRGPAREAAERELSDPRYHQDDPNLLQRVLEWIWRRIGDLFAAAAGTSPGGWVGLLVIAAVAVLLAVALRLRLGALRRATTSAGTLFDDRPHSAAEHRAAAERHAALGRWTEAVQERMRALVLALEERALLTPVPGRTADEAAAEAGRTLPAHAGRLRTAARTFDDVTYGGRPGTEQEYTFLATLDTDLRHTKPQLTAASQGGGL